MNTPNILHLQQPTLTNLTELPNLTPVQKAAYRWYDMGYSVIPTRPLSKAAYAWEGFKYVRLPKWALSAAFAGDGIGLALIAGRISGNAFFVDCDTPDAFREIMGMWLSAGLPLFAVCSAKGGHLYGFCESGELTNIPEGKVIPHVGIRGHASYVVAPPSTHPDTLCPYTRYDGNTTDKPPTVTLATLQAVLSPSIRLTAKTPRKTAHTSDKLPSVPFARATRAILDGNGAEIGNRHNNLQAAFCDIAGLSQQGYLIESEARQLCEQAAANCSLPENDRPNEVQGMIDWAFKSNRQPTRHKHLSPPSTPHTHKTNPTPIEQLTTWVYTQNWRGRKGATDTAVFVRGLLPRAAAQQLTTFRASLRETAQAAQVGLKAVQRSIKRLQERGVIERLPLTDPSGAFVYRISSKAQMEAASAATSCNTEQQTTMTTLQPPTVSIQCGHSRSTGDYNAALFERGSGLGLTALRLHSYLLGQVTPLTAAAIAPACSLTVRQVKYHLGRLKTAHMVSSPKRGVFVAVRLSEVQQAELARNTGTLGKAEARADQFVQDRVKCALLRLKADRTKLQRKNKRTGELVGNSRALVAQFLVEWAAIEKPTATPRNTPKTAHNEPQQRSAEQIAREPLSPFMYCQNCGQAVAFLPSKTCHNPDCQTKFPNWQTTPPVHSICDIPADSRPVITHDPIELEGLSLGGVLVRVE